MSRSRRHQRLLPMLAAALASLATGCGGDGGATGRSSGSEARTEPSLQDSGSDAATSTGAPQQVPADPGREDEDAAAPSRAALAAGRRFDALLAAYAPVSARVSFLVAAETLRQSAVESDQGEEVERERFGAVRLEVERMRQVLRAARPRVAAATVADVDQQHVQALMLAAIDERRRAMRELEAALDALGGGDASGLGTRLLVERWQASWDESLRWAREATTRMQDTRARLGLEPASEEAIR